MNLSVGQIRTSQNPGGNTGCGKIDQKAITGMPLTAKQTLLKKYLCGSTGNKFLGITFGYVVVSSRLKPVRTSS